MRADLFDDANAHAPRHLKPRHAQQDLIAAMGVLLLVVAALIVRAGSDMVPTTLALLPIGAALLSVGELWHRLRNALRRAAQLAASLSHAEACSSEREAIVDMLADVARRTRTQLDEHLADVGDALDADADRRAARLRRSAEGVLALAGPTPAPPDTRGSTDPTRTVLLGDVARLALAEVEEPARVTIEMSADDVKPVIVALVPAVAHMFAELVENALATSPTGRVTIRTEPVLDGSADALVAIDDDGPGLRDHDLAAANDLLAHPQVLAPGARRVGLHVVSRLAQRLGAKVWLAARADGGMTARVKLPPAVFADAAGPSRSVVLDLDTRAEARETVADAAT